MSTGTKEEVINTLRACLISSKDPIPESAISRDYLSLVGSPIPFVRLGYTSLRAFLASEDSFVVTKSRDGQCMVSARPDEDTHHITSMIARQKRSSSRRTRVRHRGAPTPRFAQTRARPTSSLPPRPRRSVQSDYRAIAPPAPAPRTSSSNLSARLGNPPVVPQRQWAPEEQACPKKSSASKREGSWLNDRFVEGGQGRLSVTVANVARPNGASTVTAPAKDGTLGHRVESSVIKWLKSGNKEPKKRASENMSKDAKGKFQRELATLSAQLNFPEPIYRTNCRTPAKSTPQWFATVYIGDASFNSFPDERAKVEEAKELAAEKACVDFRKRVDRLQETVDRHSPMQDALDIIEKMVNSKPNGIFSDHVEADYLEKYGQRLPSCWLEEGAERMFFEISQVGNKSILYPVSPSKKEAFILKNKIQMDGRILTVNNNNIQMDGRISSVVPQPPVRTPSFTLSVSSDGFVESVSKLDLPSYEEWDVYVTGASSPGQVWGRLIGEQYDGMYDVVLTEMDLHMMDKKRKAPKPIKINGYYAVNMDQCWLRAQVTEILQSGNPSEEDSVEIFLIDNGEVDTVPVSSLYVLEPMFAVLPAQAIRCRLAFAEVLGEDASVWSLLVEQVVGKSFVAEVVERGNDNEDHVIVLHDTSVDPPVDVNAKLLSEAFRKLPPPRLPLKGCVTEVWLGSVSVNGPVYVTMSTNAFKWVCELLEDLEAYERIVMRDEARPKPMHLRNPKANCMFLAKSMDSPNQWRRATLLQAADDLRTVDLFFVDYGNVETVPTPDILLLDYVYPELCLIPRQAIMVGLNGLPSHRLSSQVVSLIRALAPLDKPLLGKVIEAGSGDQLSVLSLFFRIPPNNILASVNDNVLLTLETSELKTDPMTERGDSRTDSISVRADSRNGKSESKSYRLESNGRVESSTNLNPLRSGRPQLVNGTIDSKNSPNNRPLNGISRTQDKVAPVLCRGLSAPSIPGVGEGFFQVHVTLASSPDLFVVQPLSSFSERQEMMKQLQDHCNSNTLLPSTEIEVHNLYAARNTDNTWYRVSVVRKDNNCYTVYLCDFGDMAVIPAKNFLCLDNEFRKLPYQAIRAKLTGIKPVNVNWSLADCKEFQTRVVTEFFQAQVTEKAPDLPDLLNCQDSIIGLRLLDTQDAHKDICIAEWLVEKGRACKI